ncbi:MAG: small ribosomal subunit Rsm22 family protein, partial [Pseudomonadota bacterium]
NVLNELDELGEGRMGAVLCGLLDRVLERDGKLVVIEPALLRVSRKLTSLRDAVLKSGRYSTPAPCGHSERCPLNAEPKDWCHFEAAWDPPPLRRRLEEFLDHRARSLKYSYVVFEQREKKRPEFTYRVLSDPLESREGACVLLCSPERKIALYYNRNSKAGAIIQGLRRGDWVRAKIDAKLISDAPVRRYALEIKAPDDLEIGRL